MRACPASHSTGTDGIWCMLERQRSCRVASGWSQNKWANVDNHTARAMAKERPTGAQAGRVRTGSRYRKYGIAGWKNDTPPGLGGLQASGFVLSSSDSNRLTKRSWSMAGVRTLLSVQMYRHAACCIMVFWGGFFLFVWVCCWFFFFNCSSYILSFHAKNRTTLCSKKGGFIGHSLLQRLCLRHSELVSHWGRWSGVTHTI